MDPNKITNTVYKNSKCSFYRRSSGYKYVTASSDIKKGELILLEHCFYCMKDEAESMVNMLRFNRDFYNELCPRTSEWNDRCITTTEYDELLLTKMEDNCFIDGNYVIIGKDISWFNHSKNANSYVRCEHINFSTFSSIAMSVIAGRNIYAGSELCVSYGKDVTFAIKEPKQITNKMEKFVMDDRDGELARSILKQYKSKQICRDIIKNHVCLNQGFYRLGKLVAPTEKFSKFIENLHGAYTEENVDTWLKNMDSLLIDAAQ